MPTYLTTWTVDPDPSGTSPFTAEDDRAALEKGREYRDRLALDLVRDGSTAGVHVRVLTLELTDSPWTTTTNRAVFDSRDDDQATRRRHKNKRAARPTSDGNNTEP